MPAAVPTIDADPSAGARVASHSFVISLRIEDTIHKLNKLPKPKVHSFYTTAEPFGRRPKRSDRTNSTAFRMFPLCNNERQSISGIRQTSSTGTSDGIGSSSSTIVARWQHSSSSSNRRRDSSSAAGRRRYRAPLQFVYMKRYERKALNRHIGQPRL